MLIAIPSKGRAGKVKSLDILHGATLFVPDYEVQDYFNAGHEKVIGVPAKVKGITCTRNWILRSTKDRYVVFVDDDHKRSGWIEMFSHHTRHRKLTEEQWYGEFRKLFEVTEGYGFRLWGIATDGAPCSVYPFKPFLFHTYVTASCCGLVNDGLTYFDERFPVKEDYELCLRLIKEDGGIIGARHIFWTNFHWAEAGGCRDYRTQAMERDCIRRLRKMYPGAVRQVNKGGSEFSIALNF